MTRQIHKHTPATLIVAPFLATGSVAACFLGASLGSFAAAQTEFSYSTPRLQGKNVILKVIAPSAGVVRAGSDVYAGPGPRKKRKWPVLFVSDDARITAGGQAELRMPLRGIVRKRLKHQVGYREKTVFGVEFVPDGSSVAQSGSASIVLKGRRKAP